MVLFQVKSSDQDSDKGDYEGSAPVVHETTLDN